MKRELQYTLGELIVLRLDCTNEQRLSYVLKVYDDQSALVFVQGGGRVQLFPNGVSKNALFTVIIKDSKSWDTQQAEKHLMDSVSTSPTSKRAEEIDGYLQKVHLLRSLQQK